MPHQIGFVDNSDGTLAHHAMLQLIHDFASANGWTVLRYDTESDNRELILRGAGLSGTEEIYIGFMSYENVDNDYYNLAVAGFTGYVDGNSFDTQPGALILGVPAHNQRIDYWLTLNAQRIALTMRVGTPVYETCYAGKFNAYARPSQYPYPLVVSGMLSSASATRFSDTSHAMGYRGNRANFRMRFNDGSWHQPDCWPWNNGYVAGNAYVGGINTQQRPLNGYYPLNAIIINDSDLGVLGELDGLRHITGFDNAVENTTTDSDGNTWVVFQDVARTGFNDFYALRMDN